MDYIQRLVNQEELSREDTRQFMLGITRQEYSDVAIGAALSCLQMRGISPEELLGFRDALLETGVNSDLSEYSPIDIVGTGGDGKNTFNISTCSIFVVAGAGYKVAKHGNYSATSTSGASNVLEGHGVHFTNDLSKLRRSIEESGVAYLHAQLFATAMRFVGPVRKALTIPTCFNLLGPLINPARPKHQLLGVANLRQMRLYSHALCRLGIRFGIVNSTDGYDEISLTGRFKVLTSDNERIYAPGDLGFPTVKPEDLYCGGTKESAIKTFDNVLNGTAPQAQRDVVVCNAAFAIQVLEPAKSIEECIALARESLQSGKALQSFNKFVELNS